MPKMCWAELGADGFAERIFKNAKQAVLSGVTAAFILRAVAVTTIRRKIWLRDNKTCTHCGATVLWGVMNMHERCWRGRGGEISLENGTCLCYSCHIDDPVAGHGKRRVQWSK